MCEVALTVPVVVMLDVEFSGDITLPLKLNPAAFKLPPMTFPVTDAIVALTLPPLMLPVVLILPDPALILPPMILPLVLISYVEYKPLTTQPVKLK